MTALAFAGQTVRRFPAVVQQFNMLRPARYRGPSAFGDLSSTVENWAIKADYLKDWLVYNLQDEGGADTDTASFGAFTTAPDATTDTARLLVDTAANTEHSFVAGWCNVSQRHFGKLRLAAYFKYAGRRVVLAIVSGLYPAQYGCKAVFDLQSGRVAVDTTAFGSVDVPWTVFPAQIYHVGSGWYLCIIDAIANNATGAVPGALFGKVYLDNGTGLAAESHTYSGNGTSGVYAWRANMLPTRMWDLRTVTFFDDFDDVTMANVDLGNTKAAGFDWYINNTMPRYGPLAHTDPDDLTVADSAITCASIAQPLFLSSIASLWSEVGPKIPDYVGTVYTLPALFECSAWWDTALSNQHDFATFWTAGVEHLMVAYPGPATGDYRERDFFEAFEGGPPTTDLYQTEVHYGSGAAAIGLPKWQANHTYAGASVNVMHLGVPYSSLRSTVNEAPDSSPTAWGTYVARHAGAQLPAADYENPHRYASVCLPSTADEPGQTVNFFDDCMVAFPTVWGVGVAGYTVGMSGAAGIFDYDVLSRTDGQHWPLFLGGSLTMPVSFGFVKVTQ